MGPSPPRLVRRRGVLCVCQYFLRHARQPDQHHPRQQPGLLYRRRDDRKHHQYHPPAPRSRSYMGFASVPEQDLCPEHDLRRSEQRADHPPQ
ncbi:MAG: hypothetical protein MZV64_18015 [Ignavibacteriales bacterium]|nr:hypothetical protein [Ignavibacteriales bacterium]